MKCNTYKKLGFSLVELMVTVAISGILILAINSIYSNYVQQKYAIESKAAALADIDTASKFLRALLPSVIYNTTGVDGTTQLPAGWWDCTTDQGCYLTAFMVAGQTSHNRILSSECVAISDSILQASNINTISLDTDNPGSCAQCASGYKPITRIENYGKIAVGDTSPAIKNDIVIPGDDNTIKPGTIAMNICLNTAGYQYNRGTSAAQDMVTRYDRWTITLVAVYLKAPIPPNATGAQVSSLLAKITERIMVSPPSQLGKDINYIPYR